MRPQIIATAQLSLLPFRTCSRCGEEKALTEFGLSRTHRGGRRKWCNICEAARVKAYYDQFPERKKAAAQRDYERHGDGIRRRVRQYATDNAEIVRKRKRDYYRRNKSRWVGLAQARRLRLSRPDELAVAYVRVLRDDPCCYCGQPMKHIDHIDPVSRGGSNEWDNLTAACERCNRAKYSNPLFEFLIQKGTVSDRTTPQNA